MTFVSPSAKFRGLLLLLFVDVASAYQAPAEPFDMERETYKIYSQLMSPPESSHGENPRYLISVTAQAERRDPTECIHPPASYAARFKEVLLNFADRRKNVRTLERKLSISKPYELLSKADVDKFHAEKMYPLPPGKNQTVERFRGVTDLFTFSDVYFSKEGTLALVHMGSWCGGLCAHYSWRVFERSAGGGWTELRWTTCIIIAGTLKQSARAT